MREPPVGGGSAALSTVVSTGRVGVPSGARLGAASAGRGRVDDAGLASRGREVVESVAGRRVGAGSGAAIGAGAVSGALSVGPGPSGSAGAAIADGSGKAPASGSAGGAVCAAPSTSAGDPPGAAAPLGAVGSGAACAPPGSPSGTGAGSGAMTAGAVVPRGTTTSRSRATARSRTPPSRTAASAARFPDPGLRWGVPAAAATFATRVAAPAAMGDVIASPVVADETAPGSTRPEPHPVRVSRPGIQRTHFDPLASGCAQRRARSRRPARLALRRHRWAAVRDQAPRRWRQPSGRQMCTAARPPSPWRAAARRRWRWPRSADRAARGQGSGAEPPRRSRCRSRRVPRRPGAR